MQETQLKPTLTVYDLRCKNDPTKTCDGLKSFGNCPPDYAWAFKNGKMCCSCDKQNQEQVMGYFFSLKSLIGKFLHRGS